MEQCKHCGGKEFIIEERKLCAECGTAVENFQQLEIENEMELNMNLAHNKSAYLAVNKKVTEEDILKKKEEALQKICEQNIDRK